jgi:hypothetical protein
MEAILDQNQDLNGEQLAKFAHSYEFPEFVKRADIQTEVRSPANVASNAFADATGRKFPCHTKAATWLSHIYFLTNRTKMASSEAIRTGEGLRKFADYWRITNSVEEVKQRFAKSQEDDLSKLADADFAYVWANEDGAKDRHLPLRNSAEVKAAASWLEEYRDQFIFRDRQVIAEKILGKAAEFGASTGGREEFLQKQAGQGICNPDEVVHQLQLRVMAVGAPSMKQEIRKLAAAIEANPSATLGPNELRDLAITVDSVDRGAGITHKYAEGAITRPEDFLFKVTYREAEKVATGHCSLTTGSVYACDSFNKLALSDLRAVFGSDFADDVSTGLQLDAEKMADIAPTLPRPDAELLDSLMKEAGIQPVLKEAAQQSVGWSPDQWDGMAKSLID